MSLKTRCPACDTVFKIVPDLLKVSKGWVRCGRCAEVFDAMAQAADVEKLIVASTASTSSSTSFSTTSPIASSTSTSSSTNTSAKNTPNTIAIKEINTPSTAKLATQNSENSENTPVIEDDTSADLSFVRAAKNKAFWQHSTVTRTLSAACIGLAGLFFVQVVYSQRNHVAASYPVLKPSFETMCQNVGCSIEPYKNIDAFKIDSSSFQKSQLVSPDITQGDNFALKLAIKNNAELAVAMPAVELTLTDTNDKAVLRRVITTKELGISGDTLAANGDWASSIAVVVTPSSTKASFSGYRVLLFYP